MRRFLPVLLLCLVGGTAAACTSSVGAIAANVDGTVISQAELTSDLSAISANAALRCYLASSEPVLGAGVTGTYSASFAATRLTSTIDTTVITDELHRRHLSVSPLAVSIAKSQLASFLQPQQGSSCTIPGTTAVATFSPELERSLIESQAASDALTASLGGEPLTTAGVAAYARSHPSASSLQCISDIVVKDRATASRLRNSIVGGASFATVARASSIDTSNAQNGGTDGCVSAGDFPTSLGSVIVALPLNVISPVTAFNGYFVLLDVTARHASSTVAAQALIARGSSAEQRLITTLVRGANVEVNPAYGTWAKVGSTYEVRPNSGPATKFLGNVSAITPGTTAP
jgi:hypothetical protein